jgi:hypothetical protein
LADESFQYPGGNDLLITLNFGWQCQIRELATDGLKAEYEDMLDDQLLTLWPLADDRGPEIDGLLESGLNEPDKSIDKIGWAREKRKRCWQKKKLIMELAHAHFPLVQRVPDYSADMDEFQKFMGKP